MINSEDIRNFSIIAHIDHGKSTLADRMLEITNTVEKRKMKEQVLDTMDLERERGITIKMQPARMTYQQKGKEYCLNLIDTPGHIDFSYEVSRALKAVEGVILLVDATQGVQAQTLTVLDMARESELKIIPVINKIDLPSARVDETKLEVMELLDCQLEDILEVSGKTGQGVSELLEKIIIIIPPPRKSLAGDRALVFDYEYSNHKGIIIYMRIMDGKFSKGETFNFMGANEKFIALEAGIFSPSKIITDSLSFGEIGYLATGLKKPDVVKVGDTISSAKNTLPAIAGYRPPRPVVWASIYPESQDDLDYLRQSLERLKLSDSSLEFEEESSGALGRGFRVGFLGMLHVEITTERLKREFNLSPVITSPTISYLVINRDNGKEEEIYAPHLFPEDTKNLIIKEDWVLIRIIVPVEYLSGIIQLAHDYEAQIIKTDNFGDKRTLIEMEMPLRELMRNFFDNLKSLSSGFASFSYIRIGSRVADVVRLDILVGGDQVNAFSRVVSRRRLEKDALASVEKLKKILPKQLIVIKIQAKALGRIIASRSIAALRKDVTGYLYGGDITRKMKLLEKQKKGKKKMQKMGKINIPQDAFLKMMRSE